MTMAGVMPSDESWRRGCAAWPDLALRRETFAEWLASRPGASETLAADQYLACACLARVPGAVEELSRRYLAEVDRYLASLRRSDADVDEVRQRLAVRLLVGDDERGPRLADYTGQGSLEGWIRIVAVRIALQLARRERATHARRELPLPLAAEVGGELGLLRKRYRSHFERALASSLAALDGEQRALLRLHYVEGMTTAAMATLYRVSRATLVRRIGDAKTAVRDGVASELARTLRLSDADQAEILAALHSVLEVSIARRLREG
jgi:RNA polymerase sigma-70 factor (ECF subfamily)